MNTSFNTVVRFIGEIDGSLRLSLINLSVSLYKERVMSKRETICCTQKRILEVHKMTKAIRIVSIIILFCFLFGAITFSVAESKYSATEMLLIVDDINQQQTKMLKSFSDLYTIVNVEQCTSNRIGVYSAIAVSYDLVRSNCELRNLLQKSFYEDNTLVYLYGCLTIADYMEALSLDRFGAYVDIHGPDGIAEEKVFTTFDQSQIDSDYENIISYSSDSSKRYLIGRYAVAEKSNLVTIDYLHDIMEDFSNNLNGTRSGTIVKSNFGFRSYYNSGNYIDMGYILYRDTDEIDPVYDYFAVQTNMTTSNSGLLRTYLISASHSLPRSGDHIYDYSPGSSALTNNISFNISIPTGSIGLGYQVSGLPTITTSYYPDDRQVLWQIQQGVVGLQNTLYKLGSSWASVGGYYNAATNVLFGAVFKDIFGIYYFTPMRLVRISYNY